jgi:hypothetical protein
MNKIATAPPAQREELFLATADRMNLDVALIEKDFWVCWVLGQIFRIPAFQGNILFKGGTSLSKVFGLIRRFSEDIDLAVNYAPLGFTGERDPTAPMSHSKRTRLLEEMMTACHAYVRNQFLSILSEHFTGILGTEGWTLAVSHTDPNTIEFSYPVAAKGQLGYVRPIVVLELGTHAELIPSGEFSIKSYAAEHFPDVFDRVAWPVAAIKAERTFWEKATILHVEYHRPPDKSIPGRYSRHYYDLAMMAQSPVRALALADRELLDRVVRHKDHFYRSGWAHYDQAVPAMLQLLPRDERIARLRQDYREMSVMIFGQAPAFDDLLQTLRELEEDIRRMA